MRISDVEEIARTDIRCRNFQHAAIPEDAIAKLRIEVVLERHHGVSRLDCDRSAIEHFVADSILIRDERRIRCRIIWCSHRDEHNSVTWIWIGRNPASW